MKGSRITLQLIARETEARLIYEKCATGRWNLSLPVTHCIIYSPHSSWLTQWPLTPVSTSIFIPALVYILIEQKHPNTNYLICYNKLGNGYVFLTDLGTKHRRHHYNSQYYCTEEPGWVMQKESTSLQGYLGCMPALYSGVTELPLLLFQSKYMGGQ